MELYSHLLHTPLGWFQLRGTVETITHAQWINEEEAVVGRSGAKLNWNLDAEAQFEAYFAGTRKQFNLPIRSDFPEEFKRTYDAISEIPYGKTTGTKDLVNRLDISENQVLSAIISNPLLMLVPCHRILADSDGRLLFSGGKERHEWLGKFESENALQLALFG